MNRRGFAGVDGCRAGWIAVIHVPGEPPRSVVAETFAGLVGLIDADATIAVDMPIGLPDRIGPGGRGPERAVRPFLGQRQSSVFSIPARRAVYAQDYGSACRIAIETSDPPKKVSRQAFNLFPRIRELDGLLRARPDLAARVIEAHPELAFWRLDNGRAMALPKKIRGRVNPAGMAQRRALLARSGYEAGFLAMAPPRGAAEDDFLDAAAVALIAQRRMRGEAMPFPAGFDRDAFGLPIAIWA